MCTGIWQLRVNSTNERQVLALGAGTHGREAPRTRLELMFFVEFIINSIKTSEYSVRRKPTFDVRALTLAGSLFDRITV